MTFAAASAALGVAASLLLTAAASLADPAAYPSGPTLPANALRVSVAFGDAPEQDGLAVALTGAMLPPGQPAFIRPYLWTRDGRTVTLLFDPSRLKTGVGANQTEGRVLQPGQQVSLTLGNGTIKQWRITAAVKTPPNPAHWRVETSAAADGTAPVLVWFDRPIDALSRDLIAVVSPQGDQVAGTNTLERGETVWRFVPRSRWRAGEYRLAVSPALEDCSGNSVAAAFETVPGTLPLSPPPVLTFAVR